MEAKWAGWTVGDVARHAVGSMADVAAGRLDGLGSPEVTQREVDERTGRPPKEVADELAAVAPAVKALLDLFDDAAWEGPAGGGFDGSLGRGAEALWYDFWLHTDDIRAALGQPSEPVPDLDVGISHITWDLERHGWTSEQPLSFEQILVATGRAEGGPGDPPDIYA